MVSVPPCSSVGTGLMMELVSIVTAALRRPQTYVGIAREAVNTARCLALYPAGVADTTVVAASPHVRNGEDAHDTPVLLVHGYGHNRSGWFLLDRRLRAAGFSSVHTINYIAWGREGVPALAARLATKVDEIRAMTGAEKVHVVGHSMGGILLRYYVQVLGGDRLVSTAITIAAPHEGTSTAMVVAGAGARDLRPGSNVMRQLCTGARPTGVRWVAFYSNLDVFIQPGSSAVLRHPALSATNILVKDHGHLSIMVAPLVTRAMVTQLEAGEARSSSRVVALRGAAKREVAGAGRDDPASAPLRASAM